MKRFRLSLVAVVLMLTLTGSAFAGDIQCGFASTGRTIDPVTEVALNLIQSVLSLF